MTARLEHSWRCSRTVTAGLNYAGAAFIALGGDERREFLAEVERLTTSWAALKSSRATDVKWCQPRLMVRGETSGGKQVSPPCHGEALGDLAAVASVGAALFTSSPSMVPFIENNISLIEFAREKVE